MAMLDLTDLFIILGVVALVLLGRAALRFMASPPPIPREFRVPRPIRKEMSVRDRLALAHEREEQEFRQAEAVRRG